MTPTELLDGLTQMTKRLEDAEAEVARLTKELGETGAALAAAEAQVAGLKSELDGQCVNTDNEMRRAVTAERQAKDLKAALDMYANAWTRELGPFYPSKHHEIDTLVLGTRQLREEAEKMMRERDAAIAQGQADHRALHDALGWAHEWHGKKLPAPSRVVIEILTKVPGHPSATGASAECGDTQGTSSFGPVRCRLPRGHDGEHVDNVTAAQTLPGARTVWPRK